MDTKKKRPNRAEQRAARQLAKDEGLTYMQALQQLRKKGHGDQRETTSALARTDTDELAG